MKGTLLAFLFAALSAGCSDSDAKSSQLFALQHLASSPEASLAVSEDRGFEFLDFDQETVRKGSLSVSEYDSMRQKLSDPAVRALYSESEPNGEVCEEQPRSYMLTTLSGTACFVPENVSDHASRSTLESLVLLFERIAGDG